MIALGLRLVCVALVAAFALLALACGEPVDDLETIRQKHARGDVASTIPRLRELVLERPHDGEVNFLYGRALVATGDLGLATWPLREALEDPEWRVAAGIQLAQASLGSADFNEAVLVTSRILEDEPDNAVALLYRAQAQAHWRKDPEAALADAQRALELEPDLLEAYEPMILALLALDRHEEADARLAEAGARLEASDPAESQLAWHCSTTALFAMDVGDLEQAHDTWERCVEEFPADPTVVINAVGFFDARAEWQRSLEVLRGAFDAAPQQFFRTALAARLRAMGMTAEGEALLREATEVEDPRIGAAAWLDLAAYRHALREHGAAADAIARAIEETRRFEEPGSQLLFQHADALVVSGQLREALAVAEDIPVAAQRDMIRGRVAQERGDYAGALALYDEAMRVWPNNPWARYYAGEAAEKLGDFDRALEEYRYSLRVSVAATDARTRAAKLLIAQGQLQRAQQLLTLERQTAPLEPEGEVLAMYLMGRILSPKQLREEISVAVTRNPALLPDVLVGGSDGVADAVGPRAALQLLRDVPGMDYTQPAFAGVLRALVRHAHAAGEAAEAERRVEAAVAAHPEQAVFHEIRGLHRELGGAMEPAREAYARALELAPTSAAALAGLARLARGDDPTESVALFDRAAAADPDDAGPRIGAARALLESGQREDARRRLVALLASHPLEPEPPADLVSLDLAADQVDRRTLAWAERASRLELTPEAYEQLSVVYARLGETEASERAADQAQRLREQPRLAPRRAPLEEGSPPRG